MNVFPVSLKVARGWRMVEIKRSHEPAIPLAAVHFEHRSGQRQVCAYHMDEKRFLSNLDFIDRLELDMFVVRREIDSTLGG